MRAAALSVVVTLGAGLVGAQCYSSARDFMAAAVPVPGTVIATPHGPFHPLFLATLPDSSTVQTVAGGFHLSPYSVGEQVPMLYRPGSSPPELRVASWLGIWGITTFVAVFGGGWLLLGALAAVQAVTGGQFLYYRGFGQP